MMDVLKKWKMEYDKVFLPLMLDQQHEFVEDPGVHCFFQILFHLFPGCPATGSYHNNKIIKTNQKGPKNQHFAKNYVVIFCIIFWNH